LRTAGLYWGRRPPSAARDDGSSRGRLPEPGVEKVWLDTRPVSRRDSRRTHRLLSYARSCFTRPHPHSAAPRPVMVSPNPLSSNVVRKIERSRRVSSQNGRPRAAGESNGSATSSSPRCTPSASKPGLPPRGPPAAWSAAGTRSVAPSMAASGSKGPNAPAPGRRRTCLEGLHPLIRAPRPSIVAAEPRRFPRRHSQIQPCTSSSARSCWGSPSAPRRKETKTILEDMSWNSTDNRKVALLGWK